MVQYGEEAGDCAEPQRAGAAMDSLMFNISVSLDWYGEEEGDCAEPKRAGAAMDLLMFNISVSLDWHGEKAGDCAEPERAGAAMDSLPRPELPQHGRGRYTSVAEPVEPKLFGTLSRSPSQN